MATLDSILQSIAAGRGEQIYLVTGDLVLAEPQATKIAQALAEKNGCAVDVHRRPSSLGPVLIDLRTYGLFASAKAVLVTDSAILADRNAVAELIDQAGEALPLSDPDAELGNAGREAASRLLQALHVFGIDPRAAPPDEVLDSLPKWAYQGGKPYRKKKPRGRPVKEVKPLREGLAVLLEVGLRDGLQGYAASDLAELGELAHGGLPEGHTLVLAETSAAKDHPLVLDLEKRGALLTLAKVEAGRGGSWEGLRPLVEELTKETGTGIANNALSELAKRTLKQTGDWKNKGVDAASTSRFAGEYRKLAGLTGGQGQITREQVLRAVEDRGEEDVWQIFDALGAGRGGEALARYRRFLAASDDVMGTRLQFFGLLASFCRQLTAVAGIARLVGARPGERNYNRFKNSVAPKLQGELPGGIDNPIAKLHPFRLHRAYLAASIMQPRDELARLPWRVLETEMRIKGESSDPDTAVTWLIGHLAALAGSR